MKNYYDILGVSKDATQDEIKKAFRQLALKHHPDRNPGDKAAEDRFKEINEAYSCVGDPGKRAEYDSTGYCHPGAGAGAGFGAGFGGFGDIFGDIFGDFFGFPGARGGRSRAERGSDLRYDVEITLEEAAQGMKKSIRIPRSAPCGECNGTGSRSKKTTACAECRGTGQVRYQQGFFTIGRTCPKCGGTGQVISEPCERCRGEGKVRVERELSLNIPPGVDDGTRFRVTGEGDAGSFGGPPGDLYVIVGVKEHPDFRRVKDDIHFEAPVSVTQAALGAEITVRTLWGEEKIAIPPGTQPGQTFKLKGLGMPRMGKKHRGDQIVSAKVEIPSRLSAKQRELLEELARLAGEEVHKPGIREKLFGKFA